MATTKERPLPSLTESLADLGFDSNAEYDNLVDDITREADTKSMTDAADLLSGETSREEFAQAQADDELLERHAGVVSFCARNKGYITSEPYNPSEAVLLAHLFNEYRSAYLLKLEGHLENYYQDEAFDKIPPEEIEEICRGEVPSLPTRLLASHFCEHVPFKDKALYRVEMDFRESYPEEDRTELLTLSDVEERFPGAGQLMEQPQAEYLEFGNEDSHVKITWTGRFAE